MTLDAEAAATAIERDVAGPLGISVAEAAWGIHRIVNLNMELATRVVSIERGYDPRGLALVATGGSGPAHACRLAAVLGIGTVVMPAAAGVASAIGLLSADVKFDQARTRVSHLEGTDVAGLNYQNPKLCQEIIAMLRHWVDPNSFDLDGFRCDVASMVPTSFWEQARAELVKVKPDIMMLAEASKPELLLNAFDIDYAWPLHGTLNEVLLNGAPASEFKRSWEASRHFSK